jgi:hypothetical protein
VPDRRGGQADSGLRTWEEAAGGVDGADLELVAAAGEVDGAERIRRGPKRS